MGPRRKRKGKITKPQVTYDSDDERAYSKEKVPNPQDNDFYHDEVDDFHAGKDKVLLEKGVRPMEPADFSSDDKEEVLGLGSDEDSSDGEVEEYRQRLKLLRRHGVRERRDSSSSDEEDGEGDGKDGLPDGKSWGKRRKDFYWADVDEDEDDEGSGSEPGAAEMEEQEALSLQRKMAEQLGEDDFDLGFIKRPAEDDASKGSEEKIQMDISQLSRRGKLELLKKESPELLDLIEDYKAKMTELRERLQPLLQLIHDGTLPPSEGTQYMRTKVALYLNYLFNVSFYLMLKVKHTQQVQSHPVVNRLVQFRKVMKQMEVVDKKMAAEVDDLLVKVKDGVDIKIQPSATGKSAAALILMKAKKKEFKKKQRMGKRMDEQDGSREGEEEDEDDGGNNVDKGGRSWGRKRKAESDLTSGERVAVALYDAINSGKKQRSEDVEDGDSSNGDLMDTHNPEMDGQLPVQEEEEVDGKRGITYQILKNKGLQAPKKKELRNPRVKHRLKYKKRKSNRRGQIREARTEVERYSGELSGIRAGIKRSVKFR